MRIDLEGWEAIKSEVFRGYMGFRMGRVVVEYGWQGSIDNKCKENGKCRRGSKRKE